MKVLSVPGTREEYRKFLAELPSPEERIWYREYYSEQHDKYGKYLGYVNDVLFGRLACQSRIASAAANRQCVRRAGQQDSGKI